VTVLSYFTIKFHFEYIISGYIFHLFEYNRFLYFHILINVFIRIISPMELLLLCISFILEIIFSEKVTGSADLTSSSDALFLIRYYTESNKFWHPNIYKDNVLNSI
jgi:hypothetical protein